MQTIQDVILASGVETARGADEADPPMFGLAWPSSRRWQQRRIAPAQRHLQCPPVAPRGDLGQFGMPCPFFGQAGSPAQPQNEAVAVL